MFARAGHDRIRLIKIEEGLMYSPPNFILNDWEVTAREEDRMLWLWILPIYTSHTYILWLQGTLGGVDLKPVQLHGGGYN